MMEGEGAEKLYNGNTDSWLTAELILLNRPGYANHDYWSCIWHLGLTSRNVDHDIAMSHHGLPQCCCALQQNNQAFIKKGLGTGIIKLTAWNFDNFVKITSQWWIDSAIRNSCSIKFTTSIIRDDIICICNQKTKSKWKVLLEISNIIHLLLWLMFT